VLRADTKDLRAASLPRPDNYLPPTYPPEVLRVIFLSDYFSCHAGRWGDLNMKIFFLIHTSFFFFAVLKFELRTYTSSHSTSSFL
jgi:hypothetical protein